LRLFGQVQSPPKTHYSPWFLLAVVFNPSWENKDEFAISISNFKDFDGEDGHAGLVIRFDMAIIL
jgi:hypothetical protein